MNKFKIGDIVDFEDRISSGTGVIKQCFGEKLSIYGEKRLYEVGDIDFTRNKYPYFKNFLTYWEDEISLSKTKEEKEISKLEHMGVDPFGEEIW